MNRFRIQPTPKTRPPLRFVEAVQVRGASPSRRRVRVERKHWILGGFWFLIVAKCLLAHWAIVHWQMPVASVYVWGPTLFAAAVCTIAYLGKPAAEEREP